MLAIDGTHKKKPPALYVRIPCRLCSLESLLLHKPIVFMKICKPPLGDGPVKIGHIDTQSSATLSILFIDNLLFVGLQYNHKVCLQLIWFN